MTCAPVAIVTVNTANVGIQWCFEELMYFSQQLSLCKTSSVTGQCQAKLVCNW